MPHVQNGRAGASAPGCGGEASAGEPLRSAIQISWSSKATCSCVEAEAGSGACAGRRKAACIQCSRSKASSQGLVDSLRSSPPPSPPPSPPLARIWRSSTDAASHRTPPVQYMRTRRPRRTCTFASSQRGSSENWRSGGRSVATLGASKRPIALSYPFRTSSSTRGGGLPAGADGSRTASSSRRRWKSAGDTCGAVCSSGEMGEPGLRVTSSAVSLTLRPTKSSDPETGASFQSMARCGRGSCRSSTHSMYCRTASAPPVSAPLRPWAQTRSLPPRQSESQRRRWRLASSAGSRIAATW
mmetsp:Transcript_15117/g.48900  ORF Transcript_15117/g.48900 Transcript_15117/m.48900 type:complete len:299 (-) Transcript_15117:94-990(-)